MRESEVKRITKDLVDFEKIALHKLIWYLNAGGKRDWKVVEKPDEVIRDKKVPDYVLQERKTGVMLTLEISYIPYNPVELKAERLSTLRLFKIVKSGEGIEKLLEDLELKVLIEESEWIKFDFLTKKIRECFEEACEKFRNYKKGESALLLVCNMIIDDDEEFLLTNPDLDEYDSVIENCKQNILRRHPELKKLDPKILDDVINSQFDDEMWDCWYHTIIKNKEKFRKKYPTIDRLYVYSLPMKIIMRLV